MATRRAAAAAAAAARAGFRAALAPLQGEQQRACAPLAARLLHSCAPPPRGVSAALVRAPDTRDGLRTCTLSHAGGVATAWRHAQPRI
jgi:hypothetical protein